MNVTCEMFPHGLTASPWESGMTERMAEWKVVLERGGESFVDMPGMRTV